MLLTKNNDTHEDLKIKENLNYGFYYMLCHLKVSASDYFS